MQHIDIRRIDLHNHIDQHRKAGAIMQAVTLSSKYQVSIPRSIRNQIRLTPGQKLSISVKDGVVCLAPVPTLEDIAGSLPGLTGEGLRDEGEWA